MLRTWIKARKEHKLEEAYRRGFAWAMTAHFIDGKCLNEIEAISSGSPCIESNEKKQFDKGANTALRVMCG